MNDFEEIFHLNIQMVKELAEDYAEFYKVPYEQALNHFGFTEKDGEITSFFQTGVKQCL